MTAPRQPSDAEPPRDRADAGGWRQEGHDLLAAVAGGAIVGTPLLYTMEMWWHGMTLSPWHQLALLGAILAANVVVCRASGFRPHFTWGDAVSEAVTSVGIGLVFSLVILLVIGEISPQQSLGESLGKVLMEAAAVSLGVAFANVHFNGQSRTGQDGTAEGGAAEDRTAEDGAAEAGSPGRDGPDSPDARDPDRAQLVEDVRDAAATLAGSALFALNIAPTEEVILIASRIGPWQQLGVLLASVVLCHVILFASGFERQPVHVPGVFQSPVAETTLTVALSLVVGLALLALLGEREAFGSLSATVACVVTLGLPAVVGGAAGRLVI